MTRAANEMTLAEYETATRLLWSEQDLQRDTIRRAQQLGWLVAHFRAVKQLRRDGSTRYLTPVEADGAGWPDLFLVRGERALAVELKSARGALRPEQVAWLTALRGTPVETYVWSTTTPVAQIEEALS